MFVAYRKPILHMVNRRLLVGLKPTELQCYNNYMPVEMLNILFKLKKSHLNLFCCTISEHLFIEY